MYSFTEGQKVLLVPVVVVALGILWIWGWRQHKSPVARFLRTGPVNACAAGMLPSMLLGLGLYALVVGGFTEPSKLGTMEAAAPATTRPSGHAIHADERSPPHASCAA